MRLQLIFLIIVVHLISSRAYAGKHVIIMGGGGAPESSESTLFDPSVKNIGNFLQNSQWDTQIIFNGGHSQTEAIIKEKFAKANMADSFSSKNFNSLLDSYEKKISKGQFGIIISILNLKLKQKRSS
mgnify:CR=1 FL=1